MTNKRRLGFRILFAVSLLGIIVFAVCLGLALSTLSGGPNQPGYDLLAVAMQVLPYLAGIVVITVIVGTIGHRVRFAIGSLALASGVVGGVAAGLVAIGSTLAHTDALHQPPAVNSLILAVWGVGDQTAPAAIVLAIGATVLAAGTAIVGRVTAMPDVIPATTA